MPVIIDNASPGPAPPGLAFEEVPSRMDELSKIFETERRMRAVTDQIHTLTLDEIILSVRDDVQRLVNCEQVTIFVKEPEKEEIYSKSTDGGEVTEIRLPIGSSSLAGFVALKKKPLRIADVYDTEAVAAVAPALRFDPTEDRRTGHRTKQVLGRPILKNGRLYGVIECVNNRDGRSFRIDQEVVVDDLAKTLGTAFQNQQKLNIRMSPYDGLIRSGRITQEQIDLAAALAQKNNDSTEQELLSAFQVPKAELGKSLSDFYRVPFAIFSEEAPVPCEPVEMFTIDYLKHHSFAPLRITGKRIVIAMAKPGNLMLRDDIAQRLGLQVVVNVATREDINDFIDRRHEQMPGSRSSPAGFEDILREIESEEAVRKSGEPGQPEAVIKADDQTLIRLVNQLIEQAHDKGASDIHIEPRIDDDVVVRVRVDGTCAVHARLPRRLGRNIIARIKIMANLDIAERRLPQDGKIRFKNFGARDIELRVATIPTTGNFEDAVLRILAASKPLSIEQLGMEPANLDAFRDVVQAPYGIFLCVGPTGSGKTTTLHSALGYLNRPDVTIWTAEDPVEITQAGLRQVNVMPKIGFTFEKAIRAFLRCDPDIIMIGEMRDLETASAAIEASLTGHMVFSTLHTNNAPETITRLIDMGLDPYTFGDSLLAVLAQRLLRTLCPQCKETYAPDVREWEKLRHEYGDDAAWERRGWVREKTELFRPRSCDRCTRTGYRGRASIHELLVVDDELRLLIYGKQLSSKIRALGVQKGMVMLKQDGICKVMKGITDLAEVRSVCMK